MSTRRLDLDFFAVVLSNVASPPMWMLATAVFAGLATESADAWLYIMLYTLPVIALSLLLIFYLYMRGLISDLHIKNREERIKPMFAIAFSALLSSIGLGFSPAPRFLFLITLAVSVQLLIVALLTTVWKVSLHTTTASACLIMASWVSLWLGVLLVPILLGVMWARIRLGYHTVAQILVGFLLPFLTFGMALGVYLGG